MVTDVEPDYSKYSREELLDVFENIDRERFPKRFRHVAVLLGKDVSNFSFVDDEEEIEVSPEMAAINKAQRIEEFFENISEVNAELFSGGFTSDGGGDGE